MRPVWYNITLALRTENTRSRIIIIVVGIVYYYYDYDYRAPLPMIYSTTVILIIRWPKKTRDNGIVCHNAARARRHLTGGDGRGENNA